MNCELEFKSDVGRKQIISDLEVVSLSLTADFMSIDSENSFFFFFIDNEFSILI